MGKSIENALMMAPVNSMSVVQKIGAQEGLLTLPEIEKYLQQAPGIIGRGGCKKKKGKDLVPAFFVNLVNYLIAKLKVLKIAFYFPLLIIKIIFSGQIKGIA